MNVISVFDRFMQQQARHADIHVSFQDLNTCSNQSGEMLGSTPKTSYLWCFISIAHNLLL